jgi:hypothetical protein
VGEMLRKTIIAFFGSGEMLRKTIIAFFGSVVLHRKISQVVLSVSAISRCIQWMALLFPFRELFSVFLPKFFTVFHQVLVN